MVTIIYPNTNCAAARVNTWEGIIPTYGNAGAVNPEHYYEVRYGANNVAAGCPSYDYRHFQLDS